MASAVASPASSARVRPLDDSGSTPMAASPAASHGGLERVRISRCEIAEHTTGPHSRSPYLTRSRVYDVPARPASNTPGSVSLSRRHRSASVRSEEHTSELQSLRHLVCRLLLEQK